MNIVWIKGEISLINQFTTDDSEAVQFNIVNREIFNDRLKLNVFSCIAWNKASIKAKEFNIGDNVLILGKLNVHLKNDKINVEIIIKDIFKDNK